MRHPEIHIPTNNHYRELPVTVTGESLQHLTVIAGYGTFQEITLGHITLEPRTPRAPYRVKDCPQALKTVHDAADHVIAKGQALDHAN